MTRTLLLTAMASLAATGLGCTTIKPVGPMTKFFPPAEAKNDFAAAEPVVTPAPRPVPPAMLVTPGEVTDGNYQQAVDKLLQEMEQDRRGLESMPKPSEISVMKGRVPAR